MRKKIAIIGAGMVGAEAAVFIAQKQLGDVVLLDIAEDMAKGKALDLYEAAQTLQFSAKITGGNDYSLIKNATLVVITAGVPRKPGMSRDDLLDTNTKIVGSVCKQVKRVAPNAMLIVVTNPLDAMVYLAQRVTKFPKRRVMGMAGILDASRFALFIAQALNVAPDCVTTMVLGGHGDSMVPMVRLATVNGIPISELLPKNKIELIVKRVRGGGGEIVKYLKTGSAYYAPGAAIAVMAESILRDQKKVYPVTAYLAGEYRMKGFYTGVPAKLGSNGIEQVIEIPLTAPERKAFKKTADHVIALNKKVDKQAKA